MPFNFAILSSSSLQDLTMYYVLSWVYLRNWFVGQKENRKFVFTGSKIMPGHCATRSHLSRFSIVEETICVHMFETVDHFVGYYERLETLRH
jgi:hypothetical protein